MKSALSPCALLALALVLVAGLPGCFLPADKAAEVISAAEDIAARERAMADAVRAGKPMSEVMGANYEHMISGGTH